MNRSRSLRKPAEKDRPPPKPTETRTAVSPSRLPVKNQARTATTSSTSATSASASALGPSSTSLARSATMGPNAAPRTGRPLSGALGRSATTRQARGGEQKEKEGEGRGMRYPPSSSRSGTAAASRPGTSAGQGSGAGPGSGTTATVRARAQTAHSRGKSVTALTSATILRPPSQPSGPTTTRPRPPSQQSSTRPKPIPSYRPPSATAARIPSGTSTSSTDSHPSKPTETDTTKPRIRPAFNTLQQHYSPLKTHGAKPLTATYLAPPSPSKLPTNLAISSETLRLQNELLRLHLLHRAAPQTDAEWRASARKVLGARFAALAREGKDVAAQEAERIERNNVLAIRRWGATGAAGRGGNRRASMAGGMGLEEKIRVLDAVLVGVWQLGDAGGKFARLVRRFERWAERMGEVEAARRQGRGEAMLAGDEVVLVGELEPSWREECQNMARRLEEWKKQLADLGDVPPPVGGYHARDRGQQGHSSGSSLEKVLDACRGLVRDMLEELGVMEGIELEAVEREAQWIRSMITGEEQTARAGAVWRSV